MCRPIIESCHSLPVNYGTSLLITKGSITHKLLSWDNISDLCWCNVTNPLILMLMYLIPPPRIWWQLTCASLSCLPAIWHMTNLIFMWRHCSVTYLLMNFRSIYHSIWRPLTSLWTYCHLNFPMPMCTLTKMHTQKCGNFPKTMRMTWNHDQFSCFRACLNNVNVSKWDFECDPHRSADSTQRSRLFICVETNSWCMVSSSIASAVFWVNSAQFFSGKSMSMKQHQSQFLGRNPDPSHLPIAHIPWEDIWHPKL